MHCYQALNGGLREIRLLTLLPGGLDEPLECSISTASLNENAEYNALSYVWGDAVATAPVSPAILLNGDTFPVTPNLYSALQHLRAQLEDKPLRLWIDAVCINQDDLAERSQQVAMMRDIYSSATRVTIWLGEEDEDSDVAFDALDLIMGNEPWPQDKSVCADIRQHAGSFYLCLTARRSWWSRVWILQELAMSRSDPIVVCGYKSAPWSMFIAAWQAITKESLADLGSRPNPNTSTTAETALANDELEVFSLTKVDLLHDLRQTVQKCGGHSLRKLFMISRTSAATDPRDRIYGLLGLLEEEARDPQLSMKIPVDYEKPCSETYTDALAHIFSRGEGPYFLSGVCLSGGPAAAPQVASLPSTTVQPDLPSWVPDFTRQDWDGTTHPEGYFFHPPTTMHASGAGQGAKNGIILQDGRTLQAEGLIVDTIFDVHPIGSTLETVKRNLSHLENLATEARCRPCRFAPPIQPLMQTFREGEPLWRILVSNKHLKSGYDPAPLTYEATYSSLLRDNASSTANESDSRQLMGAQSLNDYEEILRRSAGKKSFFTTINGFIGTCVPVSRAGDIIVIIFGSPSPFVLRPVPVSTNEQQSYWLVGCSYVGGIMNGEMVDELYCEDLMDSTTFLIR